jgi:hypothetical protein
MADLWWVALGLGGFLLVVLALLAFDHDEDPP